MRRLAAITFAAILALAGPLPAQQEDDGTRLERLIEGALSGAGRDVSVRGFRGVLSGRAEMASLTISDEQGVWLTLSDAVLDWNRAALLRGRLQVTELSAARIEMPRPPVPGDGPAINPEASGNALRVPELPVTVIIASLSADELVLGAPVLGQPLTMTLDGSLRLDGGEGETRLELIRRDGVRGEISLEGAYSNDTRDLVVDLHFDEAAGGVAAGLLGLPGAPALRLSVEGSDPVDDFTAEVSLATDGAERFGGTVGTLAENGERRFSAQLDGDLRPLFQPEYRTFFGASAALEATGLRRADGSTDIERLAMETRALALEGSAEIGGDGVPRRIDLVGALADPSGAPLVLPLAGPETRIDRAGINVGFDAAAGEAWEGAVTVEGLAREGFSAESLTIEGAGTIAADPAAVTATVDLRAATLDFGRAEARDALGESVTGRAEISWRSDAPVTVETLRIEGESYSAQATGTIADPGGTLDVAGSLDVRADDLRGFSGLAGRPLSGSVTATLSGRAGVFSGLADIRATAVGRDLALGEARLDPYLTGDTTLELALRRTTEGVFADTLRLQGDGVDLAASGTLRSDEGSLSAQAALGTIAPLASGLAGPGEATLEATMTEGVWEWAVDGEAMSTTLVAAGTVTDLLEAPAITATGNLTAADIAAFSTLAGRDIGGAGDFDFAARAEPRTALYGWNIDGSLLDARTGFEPLDPLLAGSTDITLAGTYSDETLRLAQTRLRSESVALEGSGTVGPELRGLAADLRVRLDDVGSVVDGVSGPASFDLTLAPENPTGPWDITLVAEAPGTEARAEGTLRDLSGIPLVAGTLAVSVENLAPYGDIIGRPLGGALELSAEGSLRADLSEFDLDLEASAQDASTGLAALDRILAGTARLDLDAERLDEAIEVRSASLSTPLLSLNADGTLGAQTAFTFNARLADVAPFVGGFSGPLTAEGRARSSGADTIVVDTAIAGPAAARANVSGTVASSFASASLDIGGTAPLGLVNGLIAPRALAGDARFDLRLNGPLALDSLSGRVSTTGAILTAPVLNVALEEIAATVDLAAGRATVALDSRFRDGGAVRLDGPIGLGGGLPADLTLVLDRVRLTDPALYQTLLNGRLSIAGPLAGGAEISGRVDVGESEIRIPSTVGGAGAGIPDITHLDEPPAVRETRSRAGLLRNGGNGAGAGAAYSLDVFVSAPNRIFVRGRGLDAELGGTLRITGTTRDIAPAGRFDLIRGRLDILGRRLNLTEGSIDLTGALDPRLRLVAETRVEDVNVSIALEGPASDPAINFSSRPELPEDEVLALLLFGRGIETLSPLQIARLAGAVATLGSSGGGVLGGLREGAGLADLDVTTAEDGGAAVRAGAYISENIYTDVTVDTRGDAEINLNLDLSDSITVRGRTSNTGDSGLGVFFERDY